MQGRHQQIIVNNHSCGNNIGVQGIPKFRCVLIRVSTAVKKHHNHGHSYKEQHLIGLAYSSEIQYIIIMAGHGSV